MGVVKEQIAFAEPRGASGVLRLILAVVLGPGVC